MSDGRITRIVGSLARARGMRDALLNELVGVGEANLLAEVLRVAGDEATLQVFEETSGLAGRYGPVKALDSLGYRQAIAVLAGSRTEQAAIEASQQGHRNYAKRQLTWFRREPEVHWLERFGDDPEAVRAAAELVEMQGSGIRDQGSGAGDGA